MEYYNLIILLITLLFGCILYIIITEIERSEVKIQIFGRDELIKYRTSQYIFRGKKILYKGVLYIVTDIGYSRHAGTVIHLKLIDPNKIEHLSLVP